MRRRHFAVIASLLAIPFAFSCNCQKPGPGNGTDGGNGSDGGGGGLDGGFTTLFFVEPAMAEVVVRQKNIAVPQQFVAKVTATLAPISVNWELDRDDLGTIDATGLFTTQSLVGGIVRVRAVSDGAWAEATLRVRVEIKDDDPSGTGPVDPNIVIHLDQPTAPSAGQGPKILYPYPNTVFPRGIISPLVQYDPMGFAPTATRVTLTAPNFSWTGDLKVADATKPRFAIPEDIWDLALRNASGGDFRLDVTQANLTAGYGPVPLPLVAATGTLKGSVYYMTYDGPKIGIWRVQTGTKQAPSHIVSGCTVCHSVSANGQRLVAGGENGTNSGVYTLLPDGGLPKVAGPPPGLGGDSRGLSFAFNTPDGKYVLRSQNNFWGGLNTKAFRIDDVANTLTEAEVVGLGNAVSALVPSLSADGRFVAFTTGVGDTSVGANPSRALNVMDLAIDETVMPAGRLTFSNRRTIVDTGPSGPVVKFVTFLPNTQQLAYQENIGSCAQFDFMLPTYNTSCQGNSRSQGRLMHINTATAGASPVPMTQANYGLDSSTEWKNYEPFALPALAGGYFWVVFTSIRDYGNTYQGAAARKQLWVTAISPTGTGDPSHPPFYLPNQLETQNERGYWALDPCKDNGELCGAGDECCQGFCREPEPGSPKVCTSKPQTCSMQGERCQLASECCPPFEGGGLECLGGFCTAP